MDSRSWLPRGLRAPVAAAYIGIGKSKFFELVKVGLLGKIPEKESTDSMSEESLEWLVHHYCKSAEFSQLSSATQHSRRLILEDVCRRHGNEPYALLKPRHVLALRDEKSKTPQAANNRLKALKQVFKHAVKYELLETNPTEEVTKFPSTGSGHRSWTDAEIEQFEKRHPVGTKAHLALALLLYTAQRRSDVVLMGRQHIRDGWLTLTQQKDHVRNPVMLSIPVIPELRDVIEKSPTGDPTFLVTGYGKPFTAAGFGNWFRDRCNEAGLRHCSAHGLRKAAATRLAEAGCSAQEIMAITGHRSLAQLQRYINTANQKTLAKAAMKRLCDGQANRIGNKSDHTDNHARSTFKTLLHGSRAAGLQLDADHAGRPLRRRFLGWRRRLW
ncbi:MAG: tyrosine-type recombinase/integrase [Parvibaculum sp.]|jgi:integrase|nr:tyrosine-type recombinase/integrase [Parvibaculum sp.]MBO6678211.1 tyrosine-type recombinase/integrase [Parvibaculum sp.]MBO6904552.1 tyrosine-type recombinase/integrase [Parvibaculum sp.]